MPKWYGDDDVYLQAQISELASSVADVQRSLVGFESMLDDIQRELGGLRDLVDELIETQGEETVELAARLLRVERSFAFLLPREPSEQI